jgi:hypothetical protein
MASLIKRGCRRSQRWPSARYDHRAVIVEQQHSAIEQPLVARQRDRKVLSAARGGGQLLLVEIIRPQAELVDGVAKFQPMQPLGIGRFETAADDVADAEHDRPRSSRHRAAPAERPSGIDPAT